MTSTRLPSTTKKTHSQQVFDCTVRIVKGCAHGSLDLTPLKAHGLHVGDGLGTLSAHGESSRRISSSSSIGNALGSGSGRHGGLSRGGLSWGWRSCRRAGDSLSWCGGRSSRRLGGGGGSGLWLSFSISRVLSCREIQLRTLFTMQTTKPFSSILYEETVSSSFKILPGSRSQSPGINRIDRVEQTGVNKLLVLGVPALLARNLLLDSGDLSQAGLVLDFAGSVARVQAHQFRRVDIEGELLLLEILKRNEFVSQTRSAITARRGKKACEQALLRLAVGGAPGLGRRIVTHSECDLHRGRSVCSLNGCGAKRYVISRLT